MGRDAPGWRAWEADSTALISAWQCFFSLWCLAAFMRDEQGMGVEFSWRMEEMTELVRNGACGCVYHCCRAACSFPCIILLREQGKERGGKVLGSWSVTWELLAHVVSPSVLQTLLSRGEPWRGSVTQAVPQVWALFALWAFTGWDWLMELTLAEWSVSTFPFCYIHGLLCRTSKLSF